MNKNTKLTLDIFRKIAKSKNGKCLSVKYTNSKSKLKFQCDKGHIWETSGTSIKNSETWCPYCSGWKSWFSFLKSDINEKDFNIADYFI